MKPKLWPVVLAMLLPWLAAFPQQQTCYTSKTDNLTWTVSALQTVQTKDFQTTKFTTTVNGTQPIGSGGPVVAMSVAPPSTANGSNLYTQNFTLLRASQNGYWELFNGQTGNYTHDSTCAIQWANGRTDTFQWSVSFTNQNATLYITPNLPGASTCAIGTNYKFRIPAQSAGYWSLDPGSTYSTGVATLTVCNFGVAIPAPQVQGVLPASAPAGALVNVTGSGFGASQGNSQVSFGGQNATTISAWSDTSISATVPTLATTGPVIVTVNNQVSNQTVTFTVVQGPAPNPPQVYSLQSIVSLAVTCGPTSTGQPVSHQVVLTWTASTSSGVTAYNIYKSTVSGSGYLKIGSVAATILTYTDANLTGTATGTTYYYVVTAVANGLESIYSNQASATMP